MWSATGSYVGGEARQHPTRKYKPVAVVKRPTARESHCSLRGENSAERLAAPRPRGSIDSVHVRQDAVWLAAFAQVRPGLEPEGAGHHDVQHRTCGEVARSRELTGSSRRKLTNVRPSYARMPLTTAAGTTPVSF